MQNINISVVKGLNCDYQMRKKTHSNKITFRESKWKNFLLLSFPRKNIGTSVPDLKAFYRSL